MTDRELEKLAVEEVALVSEAADYLTRKIGALTAPERGRKPLSPAQSRWLEAAKTERDGLEWEAWILEGLLASWRAERRCTGLEPLGQ